MSRLVPVALLWAQFLALGLFLYGFFPIKNSVGKDDRGGTVDWPSQGEGRHWNRTGVGNLWHRARVGQLAVVLIDALRADFVLDRDALRDAGVDYGPGSAERPKIAFLEAAIAERWAEARAVVAKATPPTVTLPRLKALTTGSIPGFVDVLLNFGSSELTEDNLVKKWSEAGRKVNLFGDDTWIRLFPDRFLRQDGTTSFYVSDYTEVDLNVTRHLEAELSKDDWDITILHYLGLDHIGHLAGPSSPLVKPKLDEMSDVIKRVYEELVEKPWKNGIPPMVLVIGDHGMSDAGSHGGSSVSEVMTPMIALSPAFAEKGNHITKMARKKLQLVNQQDLAPTLAYLTGVSIPENNLGALIPDLMITSTDHHEGDSEALETAAAFYYNAIQVSRVMKSNLGEEASSKNPGHASLQEAQKFLASEDNTAHHKAIMFLRSALRDMGEELAGNLLEYNISAMIVAMISMAVIVVVSLLNSPILQIVMGGAWMSRAATAFQILTIASLGSTSFIEEEHQTIFFLTSTAFVIIPIAAMRRPKQTAIFGSPIPTVSVFVLLGAFRGAKKLNQTGDKWAHLPDASDWLLLPENRSYLSALHLASLVALAWMSSTDRESLQPRTIARQLPRMIRLLLHLASFCAVYLHNGNKGLVDPVAFGPAAFDFDPRGIYTARFVYLTFALAIAELGLRARSASVTVKCERLRAALVPVLCLLAAPHSTVLVVFLLQALVALRAMTEAKEFVWVWAHLLLGSTGYFLLGNSNSIATVDVGSGYIGMSSYHPVVVSALILLNTFGTKVLSVLALLSHDGGKISASAASAVISAFRSARLLFFLAVVAAQRYHLFVWTVFSPKLLYEAAESLVWAVLFTLLSLCDL